MVICGPTATGKTGASVELAEHIGGEIVAADSRTIYQETDIGTAKPTPAQQARIRHHLIDIARPDEVVTVATYRKLAAAVIREIRERGNVPLLVGGTGLYIRAVTNGLTIPEVSPDWGLRERLEQVERDRPGSLHARLQAVDPVAASRIHPNNVRRLIRALEVYEHTGRPISELQRTTNVIGSVRRIGLTMDRDELYRRIDARIDGQMRAGLVEEVRRLLETGYDRRLPAMQGLGYKEIVAYLDGDVSLEESVRVLKRNTRRFAKRQYTWFRRDTRIPIPQAPPRTAFALLD
ncbi:MAG: tRNA (adenosine(37)-N6)-dimethylallyltransferase MiaA [Armatimonadetes bacterium]|nr:tRNA (adenosine(37)-N6)-dimethylallyltransferase MiaA [Armatimonadota bacterium]